MFANLGHQSMHQVLQGTLKCPCFGLHVSCGCMKYMYEVYVYAQFEHLSMQHQVVIHNLLSSNPVRPSHYYFQYCHFQSDFVAWNLDYFSLFVFPLYSEPQTTDS